MQAMGASRSLPAMIGKRWARAQGQGRRHLGTGRRRPEPDCQVRYLIGKREFRAKCWKVAIRV